MSELISLCRLGEALVEHPGRSVALAEGGMLDAAYFSDRIQAWRELFAAQVGTRFALHEDDCVEFAAALLGAWQARKLVLLPADRLAATLQLLEGKVDGFAGGFEGGLRPSQARPATALRWDSLDPDGTCLVLFTSGSAGVPQAMGKTLRQLDTEVAALESRFGERMGNAVVVGTVSPQHIYGLLFRVLWPLAAGRPMSPRQLAYPEQLAAIDPADAILVSSPALLKRIPFTLDWSSFRVSVRMVFCSGGPLGKEASDALRQSWQLPLVEVYGSTETGGIASRESGLPWMPLPGVDVRVDDGVLHVRSGHLDRAGWLQTSDGAQSTPSGFELLGRNDRIVKLEERRVSLDAVEHAIRAHAWVHDARVLVLPSGRSRTSAVVILDADGRQALAGGSRKAVSTALREFLRESVEPIAIPRQWRFVAQLPVDSQGKTPERMLAVLFDAARPDCRWLLKGPAEASLVATASAGLNVFDGHFPGAPILPGVALLDWAIGWGREAFSISEGFNRVDTLKFQRVVMPGAELELRMSWIAASATLGFVFDSVHGTHASGRVVFQQPSGAA